MSTLHCPRCRAHVVSGVVHLEDTPAGLYAVTEEPVADYVHECPCGADIAVSSTQAVAHHPGQLRLVSVDKSSTGTPSDPQGLRGSVNESHRWDSPQGGAA